MNETTNTSSTGGKLEHLLSLSAAHIHNTHSRVGDDDDSTTINRLSLQQLVPVNRSLLEASGIALRWEDDSDNQAMADVSGENAVKDDDPLNLRWLKDFFYLTDNNKENKDNCVFDDGEPDLVICRRILRSDDDDRKKLLVWQYLLHRARHTNNNHNDSSSSLSIKWLSSILFLYILLPTKDNQAQIPRISESLTKVVLELSLEWVFTEMTTTVQFKDDWNKIEEDLHRIAKYALNGNHPDSAPSDHKFVAPDSMPLSSKFVATVLLKYLAAKEENKRQDGHPDGSDKFLFFVHRMYYEHLWLNLKFCFKNPTKTRFLSEVSKTMLLPMLREFQTSGISSNTKINGRGLKGLLDKIFTFLEYRGILSDDNDDDDKVESLQHFLLVATTVLCPTLPWYLRLQQQQQGRHEKQTQQPQSLDLIDQERKQREETRIFQSFLWKFIYICLQQGRRSVIKGRECDSNPSGRGRGSGDSESSGKLAFASGSGGVASMLRRRALYLLDVLVSSSPSNSATTTIWKDYILCVETFEMEGERHIIDQIWPVVARLVEEAKKNSTSSGKTDTEMESNTVLRIIPSITPEWIELLVGRILSAEQLAVRKLGVFRLLQVLGRPVTRASLRQSASRDEQELGTARAFEADDDAMEMDFLPAPDDGLDPSKNDKKNKKKRRETSKQTASHQKQKKKTKKNGGATNSSNGGGTLEGVSTEMLLTSLSPQTFLWDVLVPSWDSLGGSSVGYTIHLDNPKTSSNNNSSSGTPFEKFSKIDMVPLFCQTIRNYAILASTCGGSENDLSNSSSSLPADFSSLFWKGLWDWERVVCHLSAKTLLSIYRPISELLAVKKQPNEAVLLGVNDNSDDSMIHVVPMDDDDLKAIWKTFDQLFRNSHMVLIHRRQFLRILSWMISLAQLPPSTGASEETKTKNWSPIPVLSLLVLFSSSYFPALDSEDITNWSIENEEMLVKAGDFVHRFEAQAVSTKNHAVAVGAALASSFVTGLISLPTKVPSQGWNPVDGSSMIDRELGWAVSLFCTLAVSKTIRHTSGELLWPAIHKGLSQSAIVILSKGHHPKADFVARALLLLENGCKLRQLSGLGNGDLVINPKTQQIMPPPPNIEQMLQNSVDFILWQIRMLLATESHKLDDPEEGHKSKRFTGSYAFLISQLKVLHQSYPSSQAVSSVMNELLQKSMNDLRELLAGKDASSGNGDVKKLLLVALIYGACSCGAEPEKKSYVSLIRLLINTGLSTAGEGQPGVWVKSSRSIIQYARWAAISCILPKLLEAMSDNASDRTQEEIDRLVDDLLEEGVRASSITPSDAIKPLFDCIILSSREWIGISSKYDPTQVETLCVENLTQIVKTLLSLIKQSTRSRESALMLNDFCGLIFQTKLLREEYDRTVKDPLSKCKTPIRDGFRKLIKMAGRYRQQITRAVLCRITVGWLGDEGSDSRGISAIPYRDDIVKLLLHKEGKYDETSMNQSMEELPNTGVTEIPSNTNYHSVTRAFLLVFFGQLPDPEAGLNPTVDKEFLQYVILELLKQATPEKGTHPSLVMRGTPTYCIKMRAWQALCILSRFVTEEIASQVCATVFGAMNENLHNQIRYFLENFTIKCATMHPSTFGEAFLKDMGRTDLSLQHVSSMMIMGGNFILGKYQLDYFTENDKDKSRSKRVLASVVPWLSSTQGFSRAIAQLMVYKLIPRVISVETSAADSNPVPDNDWFLKSTYDFLNQNREMKRLRNKQTKFFERYDCELMCTPEGIFSIKLDEAEEADPLHLIDAMKEALRSTYEEAHEDDAPSWKHVPSWKQVEEKMIETSFEQENVDSISSTVQRKIIPLDSLNLALEDLREQRLSNARGAHKQNLIVCASLVDKVPNLAGLARTCEIFAAKSLILPDLSVSKMDNFQSISVGAADWIDMEEVKEEALLSWLLQKKKEGFWIVGLEQTSSSVPLHTIEIPECTANNKTVLLLGKEKEGIPVQFLQVVDDCVEIPQFGMIRSLNVHVSGAITIWELTRKTRLAVLDAQKKKQQQQNK